MRIANVLPGALLLALVITLARCSGIDRAKQETIEEHSSGRVERHGVLYTCSCGQNCNCKSVSTKPGKCDCGRPLKWSHVLKIEKTMLSFANAVKDTAVTELIHNTLAGAPVVS